MPRPYGLKVYFPPAGRARCPDRTHTSWASTAGRRSGPGWCPHGSVQFATHSISRRMQWTRAAASISVVLGALVLAQGGCQPRLTIPDQLLASTPGSVEPD